MFKTIFPNFCHEARSLCKGECIKASVSQTEQNHVVDIPSLLSLYQGNLDDLFVKFNNRCVYESAGRSVFIDELNEKEVKAYNDAKSKAEAAEAAAAEERRLFEEFKLQQSRNLSIESSNLPIESSNLPTESSSEG